MRWDGNLYYLTGVLVVEAAGTLLYEQSIAARKLGGGVLTPATLGYTFIERIRKAGIGFETRIISH